MDSTILYAWSSNYIVLSISLDRRCVLLEIEESYNKNSPKNWQNLSFFGAIIYSDNNL